MMYKSFLTLLIACVFSSTLYAQSNVSEDAAKIKLQLEKLNTLGSVLYLAAHPDDENTQLLAYLTNEKHYRTAYLSLTRGDGGQNLVGNEQGPYIGLIRTEELLAARQNDGAEQFFSRALDFGFSKTAEETLDFWGHQRILSDVVWRIRKFKPDIIICRFPADKRAGHGNHWASAILAHEAFNQAGDASKFPEQLKYVKPWKPKRILWNTYKFGSFNTTSPDQFHIDIGGYNPLLGKGYGEIAAESRSMHKSQGFGALPDYGSHIEYFKNIDGIKPTKTLMDGVSTDWKRVEGGEQIEDKINKVIRNFNMNHPEESVPELLQIRKNISELPNGYWRSQKLKEIHHLILHCSGIHLRATVGTPYTVAGAPLEIKTSILNRSDLSMKLRNVSVAGKIVNVNKDLQEKDLFKDTIFINVPKEIPISQPYWLREKSHFGYYQVNRQKMIGIPMNPPSLKAEFNIEIAGDTLQVSRPITYNFADPVRGEVKEDLIIVPPVTANIADEVYVFTTKEKKRVQVKLKSFRKDIQGTAHLNVPKSFKVMNNDRAFSMDEKGDEQELSFFLEPKNKIISSFDDTLSVSLQIGEKKYNRSLKVIAHDYIPTITVFPPAESKVVAMDLKTSGKKIGYIMGSGDKMPEALKQIGYQVDLLEDEDLSLSNLEKYDAVVTGIRAYNTREDLKYAQKNLMDYVKKGGTLVVQYNKNFDLIIDHPGPFPFTITKDRVTDETAEVKFLLPEDPVLNVPNKISQKDFKGWVQERGLYFLDSVDARYREPLAMHDKNEGEMKGSLLVGKYGKGKYIYTGLAFFRQLPAGVPGAFRLFANLIAR